MIRVSNLIFRYTSLPEPSLRISDVSIPEAGQTHEENHLLKNF
ncbi:hypothetical protein [Streptococcus orisratti]